MALRDWMIAFNNAKTMESNGEEGPELIAEYERVIEKLGEGPFTEAEQHVREEVGRNLYELYTQMGDEAKAEIASNIFCLLCCLNLFKQFSCCHVSQ